MCAITNIENSHTYTKPDRKELSVGYTNIHTSNKESQHYKVINLCYFVRHSSIQSSATTSSCTSTWCWRRCWRCPWAARVLARCWRDSRRPCLWSHSPVSCRSSCKCFWCSSCRSPRFICCMLSLGELTSFLFFFTPWSFSTCSQNLNLPNASDVALHIFENLSLYSVFHLIAQ